MILTVWWQKDPAFVGKEVIALPLALELGRELFGRDLSHWGLTLVDLVHVGVVGLHKIFRNLIIEYAHDSIEIHELRIAYL